MHQECNEIKWHSNWVSGQFKFLKNSRAKLPFAKNKLFKWQFGRDRSMKRRIAINGRDEASVDRIVTIKSESFDHG